MAINNNIFLGCPYPITTDVRGFFHTQSGVNQIKSDLLALLLTNPGERVFLPNFGTPLRSLVFEQNDQTVADAAKQIIITAIANWEPRVTISAINVTAGPDPTTLNPQDNLTQTAHILSIQIQFFDPQNIQQIQELVLQLPLAGGS